MELDLLSQMLVEQMPEKQTRLERIVLAFIRSQPPLNKAEAKSVVELASNVHEALHDFEFGPESESEKFPDKICCWGEVRGHIEDLLIISDTLRGHLSRSKLHDLSVEITEYLKNKYHD